MAVSTDTAVVELLDSRSYVDWSVLVKTYLLAHDLWDVVEEEEYDDDDEEEVDDKFKAWRRKNATALHKIQFLCGQQAFPLIRNATSAKRAWDTLAEKFKPKPEEEAEADDKALRKKNATVSHARKVSCGLKSSAKIARDTSAEKFTPQPSLQSTSSSSNPGSYEENKPLFDAVWSGDRNKAKEFLTKHPNAIRARIPRTDKIALHFATELEHEDIVEDLVQLMSEDELEITDKWGQTALALAAKRGNLKMVECIVGKSKKKKILSIPNETRKRTPIILASMNEQWQVVDYLYSVNPPTYLTPEERTYGAGLLRNFIIGMEFRRARELIERCPELVFTRDQNGKFPMEGFMPSAFPSPKRRNLWQRWIYNLVDFLQGLKSNLLELLGINRIREIKRDHIDSRELLHHMCEVIRHSHSHDYVLRAIFRAIELGMFEFTYKVLQARPNLVWVSNQAGRNLVHFAIECRQEKIYSLLINGLDKKKKRRLIGSIADMSGNCALHVAGMVSKFAKLDGISGAALQMQRELQWFKEVETNGFTQLKERRNKDHKTPRELFRENHKELVKEGERWMKETATSCTVVGALIITIMFASAFTVPGGNNGETGIPIFLKKKSFMVFIVSDAISLFSSTTSVLMFLGILTSRYAENDFLKSLPTKMILGLSTLFISILAMMVAFSSGLFIMVHNKSWIVIPVIFLASVPVILFICLQFPLLVEMCISTYGRGIFDRKVKSRA